jgi:peptidoglycan/LPS O-acetylase OafA/YrhL
MTTKAAVQQRKFRPDIEGMRAIAIVLVVLGHLGLGLSGGFVGVDVFFVISGFLITRQLIGEQHKTGRISFAGFYARRVRRILPAATVALVTTLAASWFWASPLRLRDIGVDGLFSAFSGINYRLAQQGTDYFAGTAPSPFQHYWSLAVEEQFYLLWPLLLVVAIWLGRKWHRSNLTVGVMLLAIIGGSLYLSATITQSAQPWAYFGLHTRAWELAIGALVAVTAGTLSKTPKPVATLLSWSGIAAIGYSAVCFTSSTPFPGVMAMWPVLGSAAVIAAGCAAPKFGAEVLLGRSLPQYLGKVSYSWYLWHWPVLIIAPDFLGRELTVTDRVWLIGVSLILASVSYYIVEMPFRENRSLVFRPMKGLLVGAEFIGVSVVMATLLVTVLSPDTGPVKLINNRPVGDVERLVAEAAQLTKLSPEVVASLGAAESDMARGCIVNREEIKPIACAIGDKSSAKLMVLMGDSHAWRWIPALDVIAKSHHFRVVVFAKAACPPENYVVTDFSLKRRYTECEQWRPAMLNTVDHLRPSVVVISAEIHDGASSGAMSELVARYVSQNARVALVDDTPVPFRDIPQCLSRHSDDARSCAVTEAKAMYQPGLRLDRRNGAVGAGALFVEPTDWFCAASVCPAVINGMVVYRDSNHITATYARWLTPKLEEALKPIFD